MTHNRCRFSTGKSPRFLGLSCGVPQVNGSTLKSSYTAVIRPAISANLAENEVDRAVRQHPRPWPNPREGSCVQNDTEPDVDHEVRLRLIAIGEWARHAEAGECPLELALTAVTELVTAAERIMVEAA